MATLAAAARPRYAVPVRWLHWLGFILVALAYLFIELKGYVPKGTPLREALKQYHFWAGLGVLLLLLPRVWARARHGTPPITPTPAGWMELLGRLTHLALYLFLLVQPLLGLVVLQLDGGSVNFPGGLALPSFLAAPNHELAHDFEEIHETLGEIFYWVIGLHIAAALWHHFVSRDDTLKRML
ncbi:cytochrome b [Mizugakiibacter sediminis]|nr:cytochrome b [Mizugakiibacter sediminis]